MDQLPTAIWGATITAIGALIGQTMLRLLEARWRRIERNTELLETLLSRFQDHIEYIRQTEQLKLEVKKLKEGTEAEREETFAGTQLETLEKNLAVSENKMAKHVTESSRVDVRFELHFSNKTVKPYNEVLSALGRFTGREPTTDEDIEKFISELRDELDRFKRAAKEEVRKTPWVRTFPRN